MAWKWGIHPDADDGLEEVYETYGTRFRGEMRSQLAALAQVARRQIPGEIVNLGQEFASLSAEPVAGWTHTLGAWKTEPISRILQDLLYVLQRGEPPKELWAGEIEFPDVASCFGCRVKVYFTVDRLLEEVTFFLFQDLPGSGAEDVGAGGE
jgi:hypothetical protein